MTNRVRRDGGWARKSLSEGSRDWRECLARRSRILADAGLRTPTGCYDESTDGVVETFLDAIADGTLDRERITFDVAAVALDMIPDEALAPVVERLRAIGFDKVLFGSDWDAVETPAEHIETLRNRLPLGEGEWGRILANQAAYFK